MKRGSRDWWFGVLKELSQTLLNAPAYAYLQDYSILHKHPQATRWLGFAGAAEDAILQLEAKIKRKLPWCYRELLLASNGFSKLANTIGRLLPAEEVDLYLRREPALVQRLMEEWKPSWVNLVQYDDYDSVTGKAPIGDYRGDHLGNVLEITEDDDGISILLDPLVQDSTGEWEAWYFGPGRIGGAFRYRTLADLVEHRLRLLIFA